MDGQNYDSQGRASIAASRGKNDPDHAPFRDGLTSVAWTRYGQPPYQIWRLSPPVTNIWNVSQKCRNGGLDLGVLRGHSRSLEIAPFKRVHTSSY